MAAGPAIALGAGTRSGRRAAAVLAACVVAVTVTLGLTALGGLGAALDALSGPGALAEIPPEYVALFRSAAATCPGLSWTVLAAIAKVESDFGRSTLPGVRSGTNEAGAAGPMQLGVGGRAGPTFFAYAHPVPADPAPTPPGGTDPPSPYDPVDAAY